MCLQIFDYNSYTTAKKSHLSRINKYSQRIQREIGWHGTS